MGQRPRVCTAELVCERRHPGEAAGGWPLRVGGGAWLGPRGRFLVCWAWGSVLPPLAEDPGLREVPGMCSSVRGGGEVVGAPATASPAALRRVRAPITQRA